jgi:hypothetical protein
MADTLPVNAPISKQIQVHFKRKNKEELCLKERKNLLILSIYSRFSCIRGIQIFKFEIGQI